LPYYRLRIKLPLVGAVANVQRNHTLGTTGKPTLVLVAAVIAEPRYVYGW
jgi:hypothetical protein